MHGVACFLIGLVVGALVGLTIAALMVAASNRGEDE